MIFSEQDIERLSVPISDENICGTYIKLDKSAFRALRNEFNIAQTALRKLTQNPSDDELDLLTTQCSAQWEQFSDSLGDVLENKTRDIELIIWFITSQALIDESMTGVKNTLLWLAQLLKNNWDDINPVLADVADMSDEEQAKAQAQAKISAFNQFIGESEDSSILYTPMLYSPLVGEVAFFNYQSSEKKGETVELKKSLASSVKDNKEDIQIKLNNLAVCLAEINKIDEIVNAKASEFKIKYVSFAFVKSILNKYIEALQFLSGMNAQAPPEKNKNNLETLSSDDDDNNQIDDNVSEVMQDDLQNNNDPNVNEIPMVLRADNLELIAASNNMNRDLAFHLLRQISDYFHTSEPHSPISFMLEKAIRWGYLPLPDLLNEMLKEQNEDRIENVFNIIGLNDQSKLDLPEIEKK